MPGKKKSKKDYLTGFKKRFLQDAKIKISNLEFQIELKELRHRWGVPEHGFKNNDQFRGWLEKQYEDDYQNVTSTLVGLKKIKADPKWFLHRIYSDDIYPRELYFMGGEEEFEAVRKETPFPGVVHYILWSKIIIPESSELQMSVDLHGYATLRIGPNATMNDLRDAQTFIQEVFQRKFPDYNKGKQRFKPKYEKHKRVYDVKMSGSKTARYDAVDALHKNKSHQTKKSDQRNLANVRQIKRRMNKTIVHD